MKHYCSVTSFIPHPNLTNSKIMNTNNFSRKTQDPNLIIITKKPKIQNKIF